ncbi:phage tail protein [Escherichia coli]|nr:phage tail protein [Escherichia coli]MCW3305635.1 phage tail protein [Escherichia coli]MCW7419936.1 phage tail protein [Escherichia coli]
MLTLQVHWLAEKPDGKGSRSPFAIFPVRTVLPDTLIHEPDWHGGQCQSGVWGGFESYPVGSPIPWPSATPPQGYLLMDGQSFSCSRYPQLARAYPGCKLPDLRGVFIRGWDNGKGLDGDQNRQLLSYQADQSGVYHERGGWLKGHHSGMPYWAQGSTTEMRPKNIAFNYIVKAS